MKQRKNFEVGFVLKEAFCSQCVFKVGFARASASFHQLKEDLIYELQDQHEQCKPVGCSGVLTIIYDQAVREI